MPRLFASLIARFCFCSISKASQIYCQTVLFRSGTTCCLLYLRASLRYQPGCAACFTEKQHDLSIFMPLWQSVCRPYFPKAAGQNQTTCPQIDPFLLFFPKTLTSFSSVQIFHPVSCFWFSHWTSSLQNPTCAQHYDNSRFSILARSRSPFHLFALEATFIKTSNPALCRQKEFVYSLKIVHWWRFLIGPFPANHGSAFFL